jgi:hypothetical protein
VAASVEFTVVERRGARSEAEQAMVEVEREMSQRLWKRGGLGMRTYIQRAKRVV